MKNINFAEALKGGYEIKIESDGKRNKNFAPTVFRYSKGKFYFDNPEMISNNLQHPTMTPSRFNQHVTTMISEGFRVVIFTP